MSGQTTDQLDELILQLLLRRQFAHFIDIAAIGTLLAVHGIKSAPADYQQAMLDSLVAFMQEQVLLQ